MMLPRQLRIAPPPAPPTVPPTDLVLACLRGLLLPPQPASWDLEAYRLCLRLCCLTKNTAEGSAQREKMGPIFRQCLGQQQPGRAPICRGRRGAEGSETPRRKWSAWAELA
ncbi:ubiquitin-fold modifier 1 isoform X1 [Sus scrofa]|uniref:ubiquitin-fold modifier 1 isoform X1 n=1 Tax=Sus scrofa TaxID=9823 RepID=UPI0003AE9409|nr:ubiquitin-fold modifier 1 isoform X1 [Sus scrofa]